MSLGVRSLLGQTVTLLPPPAFQQLPCAVRMGNASHQMEILPMEKVRVVPNNRKLRILFERNYNNH